MTAPGLAADAAYYLYAVVPARAHAPAAPPILPGATLSLLRAGDVAALVSLVPRGGLEPPASDDTAWMAARAACHHAVLAAACAEGPCLPCSFGTLFSAPDLVTRWLEQRRGRLEAALLRVAGRGEWTVTLEEDRARHAAWLDAHDPVLRQATDEAQAAGEGRAFLLTRRLERLRVAAMAGRRDLLVTRIGAVLERHADEVCGQPPRWSALLAQDALATLRAALGALADEVGDSGLDLVLSGPWPPYAFAREALAGDA